jgi:hypothetical protein
VQTAAAAAGGQCKEPEALPGHPGSIPGDHGISVHRLRERGEKAPQLKKKREREVDEVWLGWLPG